MVNQTIYEAEGAFGLVYIYTSSLKFEAFRNDSSKEFDANGGMSVHDYISCPVAYYEQILLNNFFEF